MKSKKINYSVRSLTLDKIIRSNEYEAYISDKLGNNLFINDPERAERLHDYAEEGEDGSRHSEVIEDWLEFLDTLKLPESIKTNITNEIIQCRKYHMKNKTLNKIIA